jgi:PAS domain S-box-containing protein
MDDSSGETIARCQTLFEECPEAIAILTPEAQVLDANRDLLDLLGYERREIIGTDAARLICAVPDDLHRLQNDMERRGSVKDYSMQFRRKDGKQIDGLVAATTWRDKDGLRGYIFFIRDVTAQKETDYSLRSLLRMSDELNSAADLNSLLDRLVEQLLELTGAESGCAGLRDSQGMSCDHFFRGSRVMPLRYDCSPGVGWAGWLVEHGSHYLTNDAEHDPVIVPEVRERLGVRYGMAVPIVDSEKDVIAFFEVYNRKGRAEFTQADLDHSLAAARIGSLAIHNRLLCQNLSALADQILETVGRHIEVTFKRHSVLLPANGGLTPRFLSPEFAFRDSEFAAAAWSWEHGQDAGRSTDILSAADAHYVPLKARGQVIGVLGLQVKPGAWFSNMQRQLFNGFIGQSALAIDRGLLEQRVRRLRFLNESDTVQNAVLNAISHDVRAIGGHYCIVERVIDFRWCAESSGRAPTPGNR